MAKTGARACRRPFPLEGDTSTMRARAPRTADRRTAACDAAREVIAELAARDGYPEDELDALDRHYRRLDARLDRDRTRVDPQTR